MGVDEDHAEWLTGNKSRIYAAAEQHLEDSFEELCSGLFSRRLDDRQRDILQLFYLMGHCDAAHMGLGNMNAMAIISGKLALAAKERVNGHGGAGRDEGCCGGGGVCANDGEPPEPDAGVGADAGSADGGDT